MISFPNCKINLGLNVLRKRNDGFHDLESIFLPVNWCDALEIIKDPSAKDGFELTQSGLPIEGDIKNNLLWKAWSLLKTKADLPPMRVHLHKHIPMGAGLGGGSADAAFFLTQCNEQFKLGIQESELMKLAAELGSDCPFFIENKPSLALERGEKLSEINIDLSDYYILVVYPGIHSDTKFAFSEILPQVPQEPLTELIRQPIEKWKDLVKNDFEKPVFKRFPEIADLKKEMYRAGAGYASMSGSGSAVFGLFSEKPVIKMAENYSYYLQKPKGRIL